MGAASGAERTEQAGAVLTTRDPEEPSLVVAIHIAPGSRLPMKSRTWVDAEEGVGLVGDRYHGAKHRHVTIQAADDLVEAAGVLGEGIEPHATRRNITVSAGPVPTKPGTRVLLGTVELEVVRVAAPCKLLDDVIGAGAETALRRRAGSVFRLLSSGRIHLDDRFTIHQEAAE